MSLKKQIAVDKVEVQEFGVVYAEYSIHVNQDGALVSQTMHSVTIAPGEDYSNQDASVKVVCAATHTPEVIAAYKAAQSTKKAEV